MVHAVALDEPAKLYYRLNVLVSDALVQLDCPKAVVIAYPFVD